VALSPPTVQQQSVEGGFPFTSASFTPPADSLLVMVAVGFGGAIRTFSFSDTFTGGGTGVEVYVSNTAADGTDMFMSVWYRQMGASPGSGTATVSASGGTTREYAAVFYVTGQDTTTPVITANSSTGTDTTGGSSYSLSLNQAPASTSMIFAALGAVDHASTTTTTPGSGGAGEGTFTELTDNMSTGGGQDMLTQTQYDIDSAASTVGWTPSTTSTGSNNALMAAIEIAVAAGGTDGTATPSVIAATTTLPSATTQAGATVSPSAIAATSAMPQASLSAGSTVSPDSIASVATLPQATASAAMNGTATPAVIEVHGTTTYDNKYGETFGSVVKTPTVTGGGDVQTATPATIAALGALPAASASGTSGGTGTPATIDAVASLPALTASGGSTVTPGAIAVLATIPQATSGASTTVEPSVIAAVAALPGATLQAGATATPSVIEVLITLPASTLAAGASVSPTVIEALAALPEATAIGIDPDIPGSVTATVTLTTATASLSSASVTVSHTSATATASLSSGSVTSEVTTSD